MGYQPFPGDPPPFPTARSPLRKCLWKLLFDGYSQNPSQSGNVGAMGIRKLQLRANFPAKVT
jgi:hypothetical protein